MQKNGIRFTSLGLATLILLGNPVTLTRVYADDDSTKEYSYDISYIKDESKGVVNDVYTEDLMNSYRNEDDSTVVDIPDIVRDDICFRLGKDSDSEITVGDLRTLTDLFLVRAEDLDEKIDMSWINYCSNLDSLFVAGGFVSSLDGVIGLDNVKTVSLSPGFLDVLDLGNCGFLNHCPNLEGLTIGGNCNPEQLYQLKNVSYLDIDVTGLNAIDYSRLSFLKELTLTGGAYDIAINLSTEDIQYLENYGVNIKYSETSRDEVNKVNDKLDRMVKDLNISLNASDDEKVNAVLIYVLSHLEYDSTISNQIQNNQIENIDHEAFYNGGELYGALERDTQICGNYAALTSALLHRVGVDSYSLYSSNHAWNLVEVDGEYYFYDATWLDGQKASIDHEEITELDSGYSITLSTETVDSEEVIESGDPELLKQLIWYKVNPSDYLVNQDKYNHSSPESHSSINFPISIVEAKNNNSNNTNTNNISDNTKENVSNSEVTNSETNTHDDDKNFAQKLYDVTIGNKTFRIGGGVVVGIMAALGAGVVIKNKNEEKRLREMRNRQRQMNSFNNYDNYNRNRHRR